MAKGFLDRVNVSAMTINALSGLGTALMALYAPLEKFNLPQPYTSYVLGGIAAVFVLIVLRAAILAVPLRSVLRDPDAFVLRREVPEHLVGRADDIYRIEYKLSEASLLFVEGESGVGKSALLYAGLAPKLRAGHRYLPIYVESLAGRDWADGPWRAVIPAFRAALDDKAPAPSRKPFAEAFEELLEAASKIGRMPVLIIDQFDDYQLRHSTMFLHAGTWLRATQLVAANLFWAALNASLNENRLQVIVATRNDMASGLEAARFIEPVSYRVEKVDPQYLRDLIERLSTTASGTIGPIDAPLATWPDLRARLLDDLASSGAILPQQLKVALLGLRGLPRQQLTIAAYIAAGGVRGLEANWMEMQINRAIRKSKLSNLDILRVLVALCEPGAIAKTRDLSLTELCEVAGLEDRARVETALTALEEGEVIRKLAHVNLDESSWRLDHDYIVGVVDLANRRSNRWELTLVDGRKALAAASGVVPKWETLLPLKTQAQFFLDRAKGCFRYGSSRAYALISLAKFAPAMVALVMVALSHYAIQANTKNRELAARVSAGFDTDRSLSEKESKILIDLSLSNISVARSVIRIMLDDPNLAENFAAHVTPMIAALDLAADGNWAALSEDVEPFVEKARESGGVSISYVVAMLLDQANRASEAATLIVTVMEVTEDTESLAELAVALGSMRDRVPQESASLAATLLVAAMDTNMRDAGALSELSDGLTVIADLVPQETISHLASRLTTMMEANKGNATALSRLADCLGAIKDRMPQDTAGRAATLLITAMAVNNDDREALSELGFRLGAIGDQVPHETAGLAANLIVAAMEANNSNYIRLSQLARGLSTIGGRLPQETASLAANHIIEAMEANKANDNAFSLLAAGLAAIEDRLPQETVNRLAIRLVSTMEANKYNPVILSRLASGLGAIEDRLPKEAADRAGNLLIKAMEADNRSQEEISALAVGLGAIGRQLPPETAGLAANRLVTAMEANNGVSALLSPLSGGLDAIADRVTEQTAGLVATRLVAAMEASMDNPYHLPLLAQGVRAIGNRVPTEIAGQLATRLIEIMEAKKDDPSQLPQLASGLSAIGDQVPRIDVQTLANRMDTLFLECDIRSECHLARIVLHGVLSRKHAIQLVFLAKRDPLNVHNAPELVAILGWVPGSDYEQRGDLSPAKAWLQKHRTMAGVDDASIREELRNLMRKRKAMSQDKAPVEAGLMKQIARAQ